MPIFEYTCEHCSYTFDKLVINRNSAVKCPLCQGKVKKLMSTFAVGVSDHSVGGFPEPAGPKMCTHC